MGLLLFKVWKTFIMTILSRAGNGLKSLAEQEVVDCNQDGKVTPWHISLVL